MKRLLALLVLLGLGAAGYVVYQKTRPNVLVLTGIVTTNDVVVSALTGGQIGQLFVKEGDAVAKGALIALIVPDELKADRAYYSWNAEALGSQVQQNEAALRFQEEQTANAVAQAEANVASARSQQASAQADLELVGTDRLQRERSGCRRLRGGRGHPGFERPPAPWIDWLH